MNWLEKQLKNDWFAPLVIAGLGLAVFFNSLINPFVLDDAAQIVNNQTVHSAANIPKLFLGSTFAGGKNLEGVYYKPLMTSIFALIYQVFGSHTLPFHLVQVALHIGNAFLVFLIFKKFFKKALSLFFALVFLIHPLNNESVVYISGLQEPLFFFFGGLALLAVSGSRSTEERITVLSLKNYVLFAVFITLSLLSKETGLLFLVMAPFFRFLFFRKDFWKTAVISGLILAAYLSLRFWTVGSPVMVDKVFPITRLDLAGRLVSVPAEFFYYIRNFFFPWDFAVAQHWVVKVLDWQGFWMPLIWDGLIAAVAGWLGFGLWRMHKGNAARPDLVWAYLFFGVWFGIGMGMHLNILPLDFTVADRWFYFPMVGFLGLIGLGITNLKYSIPDNKFWKAAVLVLGVGIIIILSARTMVRNYDWRSGLALAERDIKYSRDSFPLENNLAFELINAGRWDEALVHAKKSTELAPWWWLNWNNLGVIWRHKGSLEDAKYFAEAEGYFRKATENTSTFYLPYENLAELLVNYDNSQKASQFIVETSKKMDLSGRLWFYLAIAQSLQGDSKGALSAAEQAKIAAPADEQIQMLYQGLKENKEIIFQKPTY